MCGLAGVVGSQTGADTSAVLAALAHRGPDDSGEYRGSARNDLPVWLGHRRLAILDPSPAGRQPMSTVDGRYTLVFNGEIYNFRELAAAIPGFQPRTGTDTEVALELLARDGEAALIRLRGMFALALWDRERAILTLARDRHGEKPLYYYFDEAAPRFVFASEVRALLASDVVPRQLDSDGLDSYLCFGSVADPYTLVRGVRAVPAGGIVRFADGHIGERRYWQIAAQTVDENMPRSHAVERVRELLQTAERRCLVADVPVGLLLSGGIDSSINVALLSELDVKDLRTFSVVFRGPDAGLSEQKYSDVVARRFGTRHQTCTVSLDDAAAFLERAVTSMDQPSHDGLNSYAVSEAIRAAGLKVAVSGQASDELFLGYPARHRYPALRRAVSLAPALAGRAVASALVGANAGRRKRLENLATAVGARSAAAGAYLGLDDIFSHTAIQRLRGERRPHPERFVEPVGGRSSLDELSRLQVRHYLKNTLLRDADQTSMAHGLEIRAPYLDHDLVDFLLTVPGRYKVERERNKPLLLDAAGGTLPREVWDRRKRGFAMPVGRWILAGVTPTRRSDIPGLESRAVAAVRNDFAERGRHTPFLYTRAWTLDVLDNWLARHRIGTA